MTASGSSGAGPPAPGQGATLITVAPAGAEAGKAAVPALPVFLEELTATAQECRAAGAAVIQNFGDEVFANPWPFVPGPSAP